LHLRKKGVQYIGIAVSKTDGDPEETIMKKRANPLSMIRLVYRPGKTLTKLALLGVIVASTVALVTIRTAIAHSEAELNAGRSQAAAQEQENRELEQDIDALGSKDSILDIAEDELGLVDPDTIVYVPAT
jgi:cell division protein FtsL